MQLTGSFNLLREAADELSDEQWTSRAFPGTNLPGFVVWHGARTIDWAINTAIRGVPEVADGPEWSRFQDSWAYGAGVGNEVADGIARSVSREETKKYIEQLGSVALDWLKQADDSELDSRPAFREHQSRKPIYLSPAVWAEVEDLSTIPTWQVVARPCISHIRVHKGEVDTLQHALRTATRA